MNPNPPPPQAAQKSSGTKVVLTVLAVIAGVGLLCCLGTSIYLYRASQSENGKKVFSAIGKGVKMAEKGVNAPGAAELRKAGCPQAMVFDLSDAIELAEVFVDAGEKAHQMPDETMIICQGNVFDTLPTDCDALKDVYLKATTPTHDFSISVRKQGNQTPVCQQRYHQDGTPKPGK